MKFALLETFNVLTGDENGVAKLERWYSKSKQRYRESEPKVKVTESPKKVKDTTAKTFVGLPKSQEFLKLNSQLYREGVWNGDIKKTEIPEENLRNFYYVLGCDEEILLKMKESDGLGINLESRLSGLLKSRLQLQEYFRFNFHSDPEVEFVLWKAAIRQLFAKELRPIEKTLKKAGSKTEFNEAYNCLTSFWAKFSCLDKNTTESGAVLNLTTEHLPREYHFVCSEQQMEIFALLEQLGQKGEEKRALSHLRRLVREAGCRSVVVEARHYRMLMSALSGLLRHKVVVMQQNENGRIFFCKAI